MNGITITLLILVVVNSVMSVFALLKKNGNGNLSNGYTMDKVHQQIHDTLTQLSAEVRASLSQIKVDHTEHKTELRSVSDTMVEVSQTLKNINEELKRG